MAMRNVSLMLVDKTPEVSRAVASHLRELKGVKYLGSSNDPEGALAKCAEHKPDIVIIEPLTDKRSSVDFVRRMLDASPESNCIIFTAIDKSDVEFSLAMQALNVAAVLRKPVAHEAFEMPAHVLEDLLNAILRLQEQDDFKKLLRKEQKPASQVHEEAENSARAIERLRMISTGNRPSVLAIGASTGGPSAINVVLSRLPKDFPIPIVICQHTPPNFTENLVETIQRGVALRIVEGTEGMVLEPGVVVMAPGGHHMGLAVAEDGKVHVRLSDSEPINNCKPSVNYLFSSVAEVYEGRALAVIMTGMGADGVEGLKKLKGLGATVLAQDQESCVVFGMPMEAIRAGLADRVVHVDNMASEIFSFVRV